jgi:tetratricopeptide (TPR) repeat protein
VKPEPSLLARAWFGLALAALGVSALLAVVLVAARTPFLGLGGGFFRTALVLHVNLAVVVWFLAAAAGAWTLVRGRQDAAGWAAFALAVLGVGLIGLAPFLGGPPPVLANYLPVLDSPVFLWGLGFFLAAAVLAGVLSATGGWGAASPLPVQAVRWAAVAMTAALAVFLIDRGRAPASRLVLPVTLDDQLWGAGHLLQFVHTLLLMAAWALLGRRFLNAVPRFAAPAGWALAATALLSLGGIYLSLHWDVGSGEQRGGYTDLMRWGLWPGPTLMAAGLLLGAWRQRGSNFDGGERCLLASLGLYAFGCLIGATITGNATTAVPAHYHGTVGAVTLAYLALALRQVSPAAASAFRLPLVYGGGIAVLVAGLGWSGLLGIPRKATHAELLDQGNAYLTAMGLAGLGGFVALAAVLALSARLLRAGLSGAPNPLAARRDVRLRAAGVTLAAVVAGGAGLSFLPGLSPTAPLRADGHVAEKRRLEIDQRFAQGVVMLHTREYEHALAAFHRVLELAPEMPEAHVNAGFALLGLGKAAAARDFFDAATSLRRDQMNAYYGLALALEGTGDVFGAMQAMESYLHRAPAGDPYRRKAEAAVWEWRARLESERKG